MIDTKKDVLIFCIPYAKQIPIGTNWTPDRGWGNGYVAIPKSHPLHGKHYNLLENIPVHVHGGVTYAGPVSKLPLPLNTIPDEYWIFGWDTSHFGDDLISWPDADSILCATFDLFIYLEQFNKIDPLP